MDALDDHIFQEDDHRTAFIFISPTTSPTDPPSTTTTTRPAKRRRVSSKKTHPSHQENNNTNPQDLTSSTFFPPLLSAKESPRCINLRTSLFQTTWPLLESRIAEVLRSSNATTLEEVTSFLSSFADGGKADRGEADGGEGKDGCADSRATATAGEKIPAGFIITGPNIAGQELLFEQIGEELVEGGARMVRVRSGEGANLKAVLKKIVREAGRFGSEDEDEDGQLGRKGGRRYLDYDLEALHDVVKTKGGKRVVVAFQDSEGFDNALLADLVRLFWEWRGRIGFEVLFGIATSVELFQARLLKSTARLMVGRQFDVVQADKVLERVFRSAVVGARAKVRVGEGLLRGWVERQGGEVVGVGGFVSSLKYAYMCHFYANPLSFLLAEETELEREVLQSEHLEAVRTLESFRTHVEAAVEARQLKHAQMLLENDEYLAKWILEQGTRREEYLVQLLRSLHLLVALGSHTTPFTELYITALSDGIELSADSQVLEKVKQLSPGELIALIGRLLDAIRDGSAELDLPGWEDDAEELTKPLAEIRDDIEVLEERAKTDRNSLKSKYSAQSRVVRTTVVAQKVQLSHDTATLTEDDKAFTEAIDRLAEVLTRHIQSDPVTSCPLHEAWLYDAKSPYRDVFVPRPGVTFSRALSRPHDYLSCACCKPNGSLSGTLPTTSVLYHLYLEAGALINVADLWSAYLALVGEDTDIGLDERTALVHFYRGLGELRAMGFVKQSKKKADHIAKLKWL
ncbi:origin recognition complex subunit 3 N-terminus-domain-containing protein [Podospora aff. communis PSN243]|uniref:Origin recognition complex subunit 3 N-terminus-domain-containing protein n=1 Tax=Podospora aff. communis PSN243 TaxID=3040156 RepID=A0AAV9GPY7_9PEZI|nr:origin recognition complex subunit 3 N-terminus-domain-containing protein [Podospora aff. communis PSN243]